DPGKVSPPLLGWQRLEVARGFGVVLQPRLDVRRELRRQLTPRRPRSGPAVGRRTRESCRFHAPRGLELDVALTIHRRPSTVCLARRQLYRVPPIVEPL